MEALNGFFSMFHIGGGFPRIFGRWVTFPFDQVENPLAIPRNFGIDHTVNFVVLVFIVDYLWRRAHIIGSMLFCFFKWGKERVMEHGVNAPGWGKL